MRGYHLQVRIAGDLIVEFDGSNLKQAKQYALSLACDYLKAHPEHSSLRNHQFEITDATGRLLLKIPARVCFVGEELESDTPG